MAPAQPLQVSRNAHRSITRPHGRSGSMRRRSSSVGGMTLTRSAMYPPPPGVNRHNGGEETRSVRQQLLEVETNIQTARQPVPQTTKNAACQHDGNGKQNLEINDNNVDKKYDAKKKEIKQIK